MGGGEEGRRPVDKSPLPNLPGALGWSQARGTSSSHRVAAVLDTGLQGTGKGRQVLGSGSPHGGRLWSGGQEGPQQRRESPEGRWEPGCEECSE